MAGLTKTLVQCDFDGTVTEEDISFMLLDTYADGDWRQRLKEYEEGRITVGRFNTEAFAMVKASKESLLKTTRSRVKIRAGFQEMVTCCRRKGFRLVIVSNGLDFYIDAILQDIGLGDIEVLAARTQFAPDGLKVQYVGPDGNQLDSDFKDAHTDSFLREGYRLIYMGNGTSDFSPARRCHYIFATGNLLGNCQQAKLKCVPFNDFYEVVNVLGQL